MDLKNEESNITGKELKLSQKPEEVDNKIDLSQTLAGSKQASVEWDEIVDTLSDDKEFMEATIRDGKDLDTGKNHHHHHHEPKDLIQLKEEDDQGKDAKP